MIYAELIHNPYLLQTQVSFNGNAPRINSQIEKYENQTLKNWVHHVPSIFYNEMNGYDFDLNFTGTVHDFDEVQRAFLNAGISPEQVRLFHKNELEDADIKSREIDALLEWFQCNPNRKFDYETFQTEHAELFEGRYPYVIIRGNVPDNSDPLLGIETVNSSDELTGTLLTHTPILFVVEEETMELFRRDLNRILERKDIAQNQLFFMIHSALNADQVKRIICDLGVEMPQIISSYRDAAVMAYLRNYPITEYIREAIKVFRVEEKAISDILSVENTESETINAEIRTEIDRLDQELSRLKDTDEFFMERDNFNTRHVFIDYLKALETNILGWRNRKTKVVGEREAEIAAMDYDAELCRYIGVFEEGLKAEYQAICKRIQESFQNQYAAQGIDIGFAPDHIRLPVLPEYTVPQITQNLLALQEVTYEETKSEFIGIFLKSSTKEASEPVRVVTCYYERWRNFAVNIIMPVADQYVEYATKALSQYYNDLAEAYHMHLSDLISSWTEKKEAVSAQLSDDERNLQEDNDWHREFVEQLIRIERG